MPRLSKPLANPAESPTGLSLSGALVMWQRSLVAGNIAPRTRRQYAYALSVASGVIGDKPITLITRSDIEALVADLFGRGWKPASVSSVWRPLRTFLNWAAEHPDIPLTVSPLSGMRAPVVPVEPAAFPSTDELRRVIAGCVTRSRYAFRARRDEAILRMFATCGMRLAELANLRLEDVHLADKVPTIDVLGKGRKWRTLPLDKATADALTAYLRLERPRSPYAGSEAVWLATRGPMTPSGIAQMTVERAKAVGVQMHAHALRHYAIHGMLAAGMSEGDTMAISGHSSRSMMDRYAAARRAERARDAFLSAPRASL